MQKLCFIVGLLLITISPTVGQTLRTTFLKPGEHLEGVGGAPLGAAGPLERIRLSGFISRRVNYLGDFQGAVSINTPQKALDFVRLITSYSTYYLALWPRTLFVEVMDRTQAKRMSNYGLPDAHYWQEQSGFMGILSETAAKSSGLSRASVTPDHDGYVVTRWLLREDNRIDFVEEKVSRDGKYHREIIKERIAPSLPGTLWMIPKTE